MFALLLWVFCIKKKKEKKKKAEFWLSCLELLWCKVIIFDSFEKFKLLWSVFKFTAHKMHGAKATRLQALNQTPSTLCCWDRLRSATNWPRAGVTVSFFFFWNVERDLLKYFGNVTVGSEEMSSLLSCCSLKLKVSLSRSVMQYGQNVTVKTWTFGSVWVPRRDIRCAGKKAKRVSREKGGRALNRCSQNHDLFSTVTKLWHYVFIRWWLKIEKEFALSLLFLAFIVAWKGSSLLKMGRSVASRLLLYIFTVHLQNADVSVSSCWSCLTVEYAWWHGWGWIEEMSNVRAGFGKTCPRVYLQ